jgi:hypothetical protein
VGDEACTGCHVALTRSYRQHPMGRSLAPVAFAAPVERFDQAARNPFDALGFRYQVDRQGEGVVHKESATDSQGRVLAALAAEVSYAIGSGQRGRSYLINRDGYLFLSPLTWYPMKQVWDLSPGYTAANNPHFGRPIVAGCLFCHANQFDPVEHTANRYCEPLFRGHAIGCERCHGPGELHVQRRRGLEEVADVDDTIVNPRRLEHDLRESVCRQCHLQAEQRVLRRGRAYLDYRPGLPLDLFFTDLVKPHPSGSEEKFVGTVEQMIASRCYRESSGPGKMGCISCHDPHSRPAAEEKTAYFRQRCLHCHENRGCSIPVATRQQKGDDCTVCHMPRTGSEINHTAIMNHRIPRFPDKAPAGAPEAPWPRPGHSSLIGFPPRLDRQRGEGERRDLGIALVELTDQLPDRSARQLAEESLPLLQEAWTRDREDVAAGEATGSALWFLGRLEAAWAAYEDVLRQAPERETALFKAASLALRTRRTKEAAGYCRRAIQVNPWRWQYYHLLAGIYAQERSWQKSVDMCRQALELNPASLPTRRLLVVNYLRLGAREQARNEFEIYVSLHPTKQHDELRRWFAQQDQ